LLDFLAARGGKHAQRGFLAPVVDISGIVAESTEERAQRTPVLADQPYDFAIGHPRILQTLGRAAKKIGRFTIPASSKCFLA
jgi:hypothetical protein